ncbi:MAG: undecaprenyl/decaprenyl-phosphate alpha-N-acetylglucosaminyl 1-phosphate transferase [Nitrospira sp. CG24A]|nr:MAG: undecaprenyl/decaprenyl-phosphate alpha-N-acetylglucosaminyl 1-phosphate transferase [Nitrospira sp. CG24A]
MSASLFFSFVGSLLICMALIPALTASAWRFQFVDVPRDRRIHTAPIAKVGGIAFAVGTIAAVLVWAPKDHMILASLLGGVVILLFGIWDDCVELGPRTKFGGQILAAAIVIAFAGVKVTSIPFFDEQTFPLWVAAPITLLVIVGMTNAVNLADGLDGLAGGLSLLSFAGIAYLAYQANDTTLMLLMVPVLGSLLGFLRFNTYPARVFMGDSGSQFLGHYLAVAAIILVDPARAPYSPLIVLFLWGIPLLDTLGVMGQRLLEGRSPFVGDRNHIHHKLLAMGLTHRQAVTGIYMTQGLSIGCAYLLCWQTDVVVLLAYLLFAGVVLSLFVFAPRSQSMTTGATMPPPKAVRETSSTAALRAWPLQALKWLVPLFLIVCVAIPREVPSDAGLIAAGLLAVVLGMLAIAKGRILAVRIGLYIGSTFIMYYGELAPRGLMQGLLTPLNIGFVLLAVLVVLTIRLNGNDRFQTTPLDYLIVFLALMLPFLPDLTIGNVHVSLLTAKLIVLFFSFELLLQVSQATVARLGWITSWMLAGLAVRASWL